MRNGNAVESLVRSFVLAVLHVLPVLLEAILDEPWIKDLAGAGELTVDPGACHLEQEIVLI